MTKYEIKIKDNCFKYLKKLSKSAPKDFIRIDKFINNTLSTDEHRKQKPPKSKKYSKNV